MSYSALTRHHFETAEHAGTLTGPQLRRGTAGSRSQGTWVQFDVRLGRGGRVEAVRFQAYGCPHVIAVSDWVAMRAEGSQAGALPESVSALQRRFGVPIEKMGRLLVVEDAWIAAILPPNP